MNPENQFASLQLVTHPYEGSSPFYQATEALKGGCQWIQLRMKKYKRFAVLAEGRKISALKKQYNFHLIINDHPEIAVELGADGVHLGKNDMAPVEARKLLGDNFIIGGTANTIEDIDHLVKGGVDYIGLGPFRFTATKENLSPVLGLQGYSQLIERMDQKGICIPVVGIGGVMLDDVEQLMQTGLYGVAVSSAITKSASIAITTKLFLEKIQKTKNHDNYKTVEIR